MKKNLLFIVLIVASQWTQAQDILMQDGTVNQCTGTFYDSGGPGGPYANNENFTLTICDDGSGGTLQLDFLSFTTETPNDVLTIYDGPDTSAPVIGDFSGTNSPGIVRPSPANTSGCLTFEWVSNEFFSSTGWEATITCCQDITSTFDGSSPAAVGGIIEADVDEVITFNASAVFATSDAGATYEWDFGDGTTAMGTTAMHAYTSPGTYDVSFVATDAVGCGSQNRVELIADIEFDTAIGNPFVDAGPDVTLDCALGEVCTDLTADFLEIGETNTYEVIPIPFDPPFPFDGLANSLNPDIDDAWSVVEPLPFDFCFFTQPETQFQVGSNGVIRFDVDASDTSNGWSFSEDLPNNTNPTLGEANIFTPGHDIDPSVGDFEEIGYEVLGTAPNRVLVVSYFEVPMFSATCNDLIATQMAVLYETTNIIDIYILNKPSCPTWNSGNAVIGIQNDAGTEAFVPPGRNTSNSPWTAELEAWRFIPRGPSVTTITWLDEAGTVVGTTPTINVCPSGTQTYTARVDYLNCNGEVVRVEDTVTVSSNASFSFDLGPDINTCDTDPITLDADTGATGVSYQWFLDGTPIAGATGDTFDATTSGTYSCEANDGTCFVTDTIEVTFFDQPIANEPTDLTICDDDNDGFAEFDLTLADAEIIAGQPDTFVNYYLTLAEAEAGDTSVALVSPYTNTMNPQVVYARIENLGGCFDTISLTLTVLNSPVLNDPIPDFELCDDETADGFTLFDLTSWETQISTELGLTYSYYLSEADANSGVGAIATPDSYTNTSNPQVIWVRTDNDAGCFAVGQFLLVVDANPEAVTPAPYILCDEIPFDGFTEFDLSTRDAEISAGAAGVTVQYYETEADATTATAALPTLYTNITNPQTVYARVENNTTGCFSIAELELEAVDTPEAFIPAPLEVCDEDNDGFTEFDLISLENEITGGIAGLVVSFHEILSDAEANINALVSPYTNTVANAQTIYARVSNPSAGECFSVVEVALVVLESPVITVPDPIGVCDDDADGLAVFDVTIREAQILDGLPATDYTITYYEDPDFTILIADPTNYVNLSNPQLIYVLVTNTVTGCTSSTTLELIVNSIPIIVNPTPFELCDDNNPGDQVEEFDLTQKDNEITGGDSGLVVSYHLSLANAETGTDALAIPYANTSNPQTIFVRVVETATGCYATTTLDLIVLETPSPITPAPITLCGDSNGEAQFDLDSLIPEILGGATGIVISFHESQEDADANVNALVSPYTNISNPQLIYIRATSAAAACFATTTLALNVEFVPNLITIDTDPVCPDMGALGLTATFDLTIYEDQFGLEDGDYSFLYFTSSSDAEDGVNAIPNPSSYMNSLDQETIYIRVETNIGCFDIAELGIAVVECEIEIPEGISPNGDSFNETLVIGGLELHPNFELKIFDRRGILVYQGNGSTQNWDGRAIEQSGELLPVGTYFYTLQLNDDPSSPTFNSMEQLYSGWIYLNY